MGNDGGSGVGLGIFELFGVGEIPGEPGVAVEANRMTTNHQESNVMRKEQF
jgi:hypothetical protein